MTHVDRSEISTRPGQNDKLRSNRVRVARFGRDLRSPVNTSPIAQLVRVPLEGGGRVSFRSERREHENKREREDRHLDDSKLL